MVQFCKNTIYKYCHFEYLNKHEEKNKSQFRSYRTLNIKN